MDHPLGGPLRGTNLISFGLISSPKKTFLISNSQRKSAFLNPQNFLYSGWWMVVDGGGWWDTGRPFGIKKNNIFGNFSTTTQYFFLVVFGTHRRVLKTYYAIFRIKKKSEFFPIKIFWTLFLRKSTGRKKHAFLKYQKPQNFFGELLLFLKEEFKRSILKFLEFEKSENFPIKKFRALFFEKNMVENNMLFGYISKTTQHFFLSCSGPHRRV